MSVYVAMAENNQLLFIVLSWLFIIWDGQLCIALSMATVTAFFVIDLVVTPRGGRGVRGWWRCPPAITQDNIENGELGTGKRKHLWFEIVASIDFHLNRNSMIFEICFWRYVEVQNRRLCVLECAEGKRVFPNDVTQSADSTWSEYAFRHKRCTGIAR